MISAGPFVSALVQSFRRLFAPPLLRTTIFRGAPRSDAPIQMEADEELADGSCAGQARGPP